MIKTKLMFLLTCTLLLCSCESLFESNKEKLDKLVATHWEEWKAEGKDTTMCIVDFAEIMPFEWDTMVYLDYHSYSREEDDVKEYMNNQYWNVREEKYKEEGIHFWKDGKLVHEVSLFMASDDEKGVIFCTCKYLIKRGRNDAKFQMQMIDSFSALRDMTEEFKYMEMYGIDWFKDSWK